MAKLANDWAVFWVLICAVHLTVCSCHATYAFQSGSTLYSCLNVNEILAQSRSKIWGLSDCNWTWTQNHLVRKLTLNHLSKLANDWVVFWVLICTVHLTVCSCHVTYAFQSGFTLCSCLNVKELCSKHVRNLRVKWLQLDLNPELSGSGFESSCSHFTLRFHACFQQGVPWHSGNYRVWIRYEMHMWHDKIKCTMQISTQNTAQSLASLAKLLSVRLWTKWFWVPVQLQSLNPQILHLLRGRSSLTFRQLYSVDPLWNVYVTWQEHVVTR